MARHASYDSDGLIIWARTIGCAVSFSCGTLGNHTRALTHPAGVPLHCCNGRSGSPALLTERIAASVRRRCRALPNNLRRVRDQQCAVWYGDEFQLSEISF